MYFGEGDGWDGVLTATDMLRGGKVSALLLKDCVNSADPSLDTCTGTDGLAKEEIEVKRLLGVFEANAGTPVIITETTNGVEVELVVKSYADYPDNSGGGYLLYGYDSDGPGPDTWNIRGFGWLPLNQSSQHFK